MKREKTILVKVSQENATSRDQMETPPPADGSLDGDGPLVSAAALTRPFLSLFQDLL